MEMRRKEPSGFLAGPVVGLQSVPTNNLRTRTMNITKTSVGILKNIYYHQLLRLSTLFQEHGADSIYCCLFFFFATNIISLPKNLQLLYKYSKKVQN